MLLTAAGPVRAAQDDESPAPPPTRSVEASPPALPNLTVAAVLRIPSGLGVDVALTPIAGLNIGGQIASWLILSEIGAYARYAALRVGSIQIPIGMRLHTILSGLDDENPSAGMLSAELGVEHRFGAGIFALLADKPVRIRDRWSLDEWGVLWEVRLGYVW
jgi:hypothetical protein